MFTLFLSSSACHSHRFPIHDKLSFKLSKCTGCYLKRVSRWRTFWNIIWLEVVFCILLLGWIVKWNEKAVDNNLSKNINPLNVLSEPNEWRHPGMWLFFPPIFYQISIVRSTSPSLGPPPEQLRAQELPMLPKWTYPTIAIQKLANSKSMYTSEMAFLSHINIAEIK